MVAATASATNVKLREADPSPKSGNVSPDGERLQQARKRHVGPLSWPVDREVAQAHRLQPARAGMGVGEVLRGELGDAVRRDRSR